MGIGISEIYSVMSVMNELNGNLLLPSLASQKTIPPSKDMLLFNSNVNSYVTYQLRNNDDAR